MRFYTSIFCVGIGRAWDVWWDGATRRYCTRYYYVFEWSIIIFVCMLWFVIVVVTAVVRLFVRAGIV